MYLYIKKSIEFILGRNNITEITLSKSSVTDEALYVYRTVNFTLFRER